MERQLLTIDNLTTAFLVRDGQVQAVRELDLQIEKGKVLGLVGESGSGKSVTALSIMRLLPKKTSKILTGSICLENQNLLKYNDEQMRKVRGNDITMIFQEPMTALNPVFTIGYQIGEVLKIHRNLNKKDARDKTIELLKQVRIPRPEAIVDEYPHQLSGGMRQRVMIAMAIACEPKVLIADEPTTALDVTIQAQILELLMQLKEAKNMGILFITHDLNVICEVADKVAVMYGGRIVEQADVDTIFDDPQHPYTIGLMKSRPSLLKPGEPLSCIEGMVPSLNKMPQGCAFAPRCQMAKPICHETLPQLTGNNERLVRCHFRGEDNA